MADTNNIEINKDSVTAPTSSSLTSMTTTTSAEAAEATMQTNTSTTHEQQQQQNPQQPNTDENKQEEILTKLSPKVWQAYEKLARERNICSPYNLTCKPVSGVGENSYGLILQVSVREECNNNKSANGGNTTTEFDITETEAKQSNNHFITILKISPKNPAYRDHSHIPELYQREVFMYQQLFGEYQKLCEEGMQEKTNDQYKFDIVPEILYACLDQFDEFIICEDLSLSGYRQNVRTKMPTIDLAAATFRSIAKMHAMSFILQAKKPQVFQRLIAGFEDNLFNENIDPITIEFGKKYIRKTRVMLEQDGRTSSTKQVEALQKLEDNFKRISLECVNGPKTAPYAVVCHGDFWNNNMLYKFDEHTNEAISAKLIDFQLSRYASPVVDLMHYLCTSTDRDLRKKHFKELLDIYYETLTAHIEYYGLQMEQIYPREIFLQHLKEFGIFGFCIASFSIPFFIANSNELPDLDEASTAIRNISSSENSDEEDVKDVPNETNKQTNAKRRKELLDEYDMLTERTLPIFKKRMCGLIKDLEEYEMLERVLKL
ncbi:uncharacterized protein [Musca autumnalis]|uniref:uncharacterized protein n=1 Tax=Musca autumnalis TaxID=221902 RepID=UPI003CF6C7A6